MSAPSSTTTRVSPVVRRSIARGSALGVGLLVAAGALAPAALADDEATAETLPEADLAAGEIQLAPMNVDPVEGNEDADRSLTPDFGVSKNFDVQLTADPIPDDLDLSGAVFDVLDLDGNFQGSCETDVDGLCTVMSDLWVGSEYAPAGDEIVLPFGTYTLVQDAAYPVPGLVPTDAVTTFSICSPIDPGCGWRMEWDVKNDSLFRTEVVVTVRDGGSGRDDAPVAGVGYTLAGPDYRHAEVPPFEILQAGDPSVEIPRIEIPRIEVPKGEIPEGDVDDTDVAAAVEATDEEGPADADTGDRETGEEPVLDEPVVSGADGVLTYSGFFIEGDYTLTPEVTPSGYVSSGVVPFTIERSESGTVAPWDVTVHLQPENSEGTGGDGTVGDGTDGSGTGGSGTTPPGVTVPTSSGPGAASPAAPVNPAPGRNRQPAVDIPAEPSAAEAAPPSSSSPAPASWRPVGKPADAGIGPAVATPQIQEASNPTLFKAGLVGFGILFIAIVVIATGFVRRRARHHG
jgi:hypothetical protein